MPVSPENLTRSQDYANLLLKKIGRILADIDSTTGADTLIKLDAIIAAIGGGGGGGTQYAEDTPSTPGEMMNMAGVVRNDTPGSLVDVDGDRTELQVDSAGALRVGATALPLPTGAATEATLTTRATEATLLTRASEATLATRAADRTTAAGPFSVRLSDGAAFYQTVLAAQLPAALVGGRLDVTLGTALPAGTNNIGDVDVLTLPSIPAGTNNIGDVDVLSVPAPLNLVGGGLEAAALRVTLANDSTGLLSVDDNGGSLTVDAVSLPLPTGAATETTLAAINTKIPASPSTDRTTAAGPFSVRLSDGAAFYNTVVGTQLPAALVGGRLDVVVGAALPAGTNNIGDVDVLTLPSIPAGSNIIGSVMAGTHDTNNQTTATLGISGVFTGAFTDLLNVAEVSLHIFSSVSSAINGVSVQFSHDGITNLSPSSLYTYTGNAGLAISIKAKARYYRLVYTNGAIAQVSFNVQAILRTALSAPTLTTGLPATNELGMVVRNLPSGTQNVQNALAGTVPAATFFSVGVASAVAVVTNGGRTGLILINRSTATISLAFNSAAVLESGITLDPGDAFVMMAGSMTSQSVQAIASAAASNLAIQEFQ